MTHSTLSQRHPGATCDPSAALAAVTLDRDAFADLLAALPDEFYHLPLEQRQQAWSAILAAINAGQRDPAGLARVWRAEGL